jgi:hypothetical protein
MKTTMDWTIRIVIAAMVVVAGCDDSTSMVSSSNAPISDVLIPAGFTLEESRSIHHARGNAVIVDHYYVGSTAKAIVLAMYRSEMTANGWDFVSEHQGRNGAITLEFDHGSEECEIEISDRFNLFKPTQVHILLWSTGEARS